MMCKLRHSGGFSRLRLVRGCRLLLTWVGFAVGLLLSVGLWAKPADYLIGRVPVDSQDPALRDAAIRQALSQVLVKLSGTEAVLTEALGRQLLAQSARYMRQFRYLSLATPDGDKTNWLEASFDARLIATLQDSGASFWPLQRQPVLVWLLERSVSGSLRVIVDRQHPLLQPLEQAAWMRGLPLLLPLNDFDDKMVLSEQALWALEKVAIGQATARYELPAALIILASEHAIPAPLADPQLPGSSWQLKSYYWEAERWEGLPTQGNSLDAQFLSVISKVVAAQVSRTAWSVPVGSLGKPHYLLIQDVGRFASYEAVMQYLSRNSNLRNPQLVSATDNSLLIEAELPSGIESLNSVLTRDNLLVPQFPDPLSPTAVPLQDPLVGESNGAGESNPQGSRDKPALYRWQGL
jgi:uncharacterized protein